VSLVQTPTRAFRAVFGVDFSGARLAGRTTWIARLDPVRQPRSRDAQPAFSLGALDRLDRLAGTAEREAALAHLVSLVAASRDVLWALDFPFGLPVELFPARSRWPRQVATRSTPCSLRSAPRRRSPQPITTPSHATRAIRVRATFTFSNGEWARETPPESDRGISGYQNGSGSDLVLHDGILRDEVR